MRDAPGAVPCRHGGIMRMESENKKLAVGIREAAQMIGVSPRSVQNYVAAKLLPARKLGRRTVIPVRALENFLRTDQPSPVSKPSGNGDAR